MRETLTRWKRSIMERLTFTPTGNSAIDSIMQDATDKLNAEIDKQEETPAIPDDPNNWTRGILPGMIYVKTNIVTGERVEIDRAEFDTLK